MLPIHIDTLIDILNFELYICLNLRLQARIQLSQSSPVCGYDYNMS